MAATSLFPAPHSIFPRLPRGSLFGLRFPVSIAHVGRRRGLIGTLYQALGQPLGPLADTLVLDSLAVGFELRLEFPPGLYDAEGIELIDPFDRYVPAVYHDAETLPGHQDLQDRVSVGAKTYGIELRGRCALRDRQNDVDPAHVF